jgi:hypothetical protein
MRLALEDLKPGMTLSADLLEAGGRLLLPAGTALTDRHLRYFQMWGVLQAEIDGGESAEAAAPPDPALVAEVEGRLADLFRHADRSHPAVAQVFAHCVARELRRAQTAGSHAE